MVDLHRHDMFSSFDGFGNPLELAKLAKELGHSALSTANHGNTNGHIQTYKACKKIGLKAILGVEGYFLPVYEEQKRGYHLCLYAKNLQGYENLNTIQYEGEKRKYYNPIWDFELLEKYKDGIICTSACVASYSSQCILNGKREKAVKYLKKMQKIFGEDFYIEIQPYKISDAGAQEKVNIELIKIAQKLKIKCILTSDSHYGRKSDFDTYLKMHEMDGHDLSMIEKTYKERYMPTIEELTERFVEMHAKDFDCKEADGAEIALQYSEELFDNLEELESKIEDNILDGLTLKLPMVSEGDSDKQIVFQIKAGLKSRGLYRKEYIERCKEELAVIKANGFVDYFLIVADYVQYAKNNDICVGPGRGSVCNCLVAFALHITDVDSIRFNLDFRRFMRYDKKSLPDIDIDIERDRRQEVIEYIINKYKGKSARVSSYGLYKVDNTINELAKVCGLPIDKTVEEYEVSHNKAVISDIKRVVSKYINDDGSIDADTLLQGDDAALVKRLNRDYDDIIKHFVKLYDKVKYIGTHAAGVIITSGNVLQYTSLRIDKEGSEYSVYNLEDLNDINIVKFDLLGLKTMQSIGESRKLANIKGFDIKYLDDEKLLEQFRIGNTTGIFQFEKKAAKKILDEIQCDCFEDVVATNAMNRPGPLKQGMPEIYANNKLNGNTGNGLFHKYSKETYDTIIYQEQVMLICVNIGGYSWSDADKLLKITKHGPEKALSGFAEEKKKGKDYEKIFKENALKNGMDKNDIKMLWDSLLVYAFNKGHAVGYSIISMEEMFYKYYYPVFFWYSKIKYAGNDSDKAIFCNEAVKDGNIIFLPHVNYSKVNTSIRKLEGEYIIQKGLADLKGIGEKAAALIVEEKKNNGIFISYDNFCDRCKNRSVTSRVISILKEQGALEFDKTKYIKKVTTYNSSLYGRATK